MTRWINVQEAMQILEENYIKVSYKTFTDWLRTTVIPAVPSVNRKEGWIIREEDIFEFIDKKRPGLRKILQEYEQLIEDMDRLKQQVHSLTNSKKSEDTVEFSANGLEDEECLPNEEVVFYCEVLNKIYGELEKIRKQNKWMKRAYKQMLSEQHVLHKDFKKNEAKNSKGTLKGNVPKKMIPKINEEQFKSLLDVQLKQHFPNNNLVLEEVQEPLYKMLSERLFPNEKESDSYIVKEGDEYICPKTGTKYKQLNRIYNPIIRDLLRKMISESEHKEAK